MFETILDVAIVGLLIGNGFYMDRKVKQAETAASQSGERAKDALMRSDVAKLASTDAIGHAMGADASKRAAIQVAKSAKTHMLNAEAAASTANEAADRAVQASA